MKNNNIHDYSELRKKFKKEIYNSVFSSVKEGINEGLVNAVSSQITIDGKNVNIDATGLRSTVEETINKSLSGVDISPTVYGVDLSEFISLDKKELVNSINNMYESAEDQTAKGAKKLLAAIAIAQDKKIDFAKELGISDSSENLINALRNTARLTKKDLQGFNDEIVNSFNGINIQVDSVVSNLIKNSKEINKILNSNIKKEIESFNSMISADDLSDSMFDKIFGDEKKFTDVEEKVKTGILDAKSAFDLLLNSADVDSSEFQKLFNELLKFTSINGLNDRTLKNFWKYLEDGAKDSNSEINKLLTNLDLINEYGTVDRITTGANNKGGIIGSSVITKLRKITEGNEEFGIDPVNLDSLSKLRDLLDEAADSGVNCARVFDIIEDSESGLIMTLESKLPGKDIENLLDGNEFNPEFLNASDKAIKKLLTDVKMLQELGAGLDVRSGNIKYDSNLDQFFLFDIDTKSIHKNYNEAFNDLRAFFDDQAELLKEGGDIDNASLSKSFSERMALVNENSKLLVDSAKKSIQKAQDSNSPAKVSESLGNDFGEGYSIGIEETEDKVRESAKKLAKAAQDEINKSTLNKDSDVSFNDNKQEYRDYVDSWSVEYWDDIKNLPDFVNNYNKYYDTLVDKVKAGVKKNNLLAYFKELINPDFVEIDSSYSDIIDDIYGTTSSSISGLNKELEKTKKLNDEIVDYDSANNNYNNTSSVESVNEELKETQNLIENIGNNQEPNTLFEDTLKSATKLNDKLVDIKEQLHSIESTDIELESSKTSTINDLTSEQAISILKGIDIFDGTFKYDDIDKSKVNDEFINILTGVKSSKDDLYKSLLTKDDLKYIDDLINNSLYKQVREYISKSGKLYINKQEKDNLGDDFDSIRGTIGINKVTTKQTNNAIGYDVYLNSLNESLGTTFQSIRELGDFLKNKPDKSSIINQFVKENMFDDVLKAIEENLTKYKIIFKNFNFDNIDLSSLQIKSDEIQTDIFDMIKAFEDLPSKNVVDVQKNDNVTKSDNNVLKSREEKYNELLLKQQDKKKNILNEQIKLKDKYDSLSRDESVLLEEQAKIEERIAAANSKVNPLTEEQQIGVIQKYNDTLEEARKKYDSIDSILEQINKKNNKDMPTGVEEQARKSASMLALFKRYEELIGSQYNVDDIGGKSKVDYYRYLYDNSQLDSNQIPLSLNKELAKVNTELYEINKQKQKIVDLKPLFVLEDEINRIVKLTEESNSFNARRKSKFSNLFEEYKNKGGDKSIYDFTNNSKILDSFGAVPSGLNKIMEHQKEKNLNIVNKFINDNSIDFSKYQNIIDLVSKLKLTVKDAIGSISKLEIQSGNLVLTGNESLTDLLQYYKTFSSFEDADKSLENISQAILNIVSSEKQLDASQMENLVRVLDGVTFKEGDSPILKKILSIEEAKNEINNMIGLSTNLPINSSADNVLSSVEDATSSLLKEGNIGESVGLQISNGQKKAQIEIEKSKNKVNELNKELQSKNSTDSLFNLKRHDLPVSNIDNEVSNTSKETAKNISKEGDEAEKASEQINHLTEGKKKNKKANIELAESAKETANNIENEGEKAKLATNNLSESYSKSALNKLNNSFKNIQNYYDKLAPEGHAIEIKDISNPDKIKTVDQYFSDIDKKINKLKNEEGKIEIVDESDLRNVNDLRTYIDQIYSLIKKDTVGKTLAKDISIKKLIGDYDKFLSENDRISISLKDNLLYFKNELTEAFDPNGNNINISIDRLNEIRGVLETTKSDVINLRQGGKSFFSSISDQVSHLNEKWVGQLLSFNDIIRYLRTMFTEIKDINSALTELKKVTNDLSVERLNISLEKSFETARELGSSVTEVINATADWSRLGFDISDSEELARVTTLFKNVGDNLTLDNASEYLISTLKGFELDAEDAENVIDQFNEVANNYAIDTQGIGEALERSAASFNAANTSLSESIALVTTANAVVQNPDSVGTTFKTLSARIRGASTELADLGEEEDKYTKTTSKLRNLVMSLTGFDIMVDEDTFKSVYDILLGIGKEWDNLTDVEQASLGEALAGKRNANVLYSILNNIDELEDVYKTAENAAGSAAKEQGNYQKSIQYSLDTMKAELSALYSEILSSDFLKTWIDRLGEILKLVTKLADKIPSIAVVLGMFGVSAIAGDSRVTGKLSKLYAGALAGMRNFGKLSVVGTMPEILVNGPFKVIENSIFNALKSNISESDNDFLALLSRSLNTNGGINPDKKIELAASMLGENKLYTGSVLKLSNISDVSKKKLSSLASLTGGAKEDRVEIAKIATKAWIKNAGAINANNKEQLKAIIIGAKKAKLDLENKDVVEALAESITDSTDATGDNIDAIKENIESINDLKDKVTAADIALDGWTIGGIAAVVALTVVVASLVKVIDSSMNSIEELENTLGKTEEEISSYNSKISELNAQYEQLESVDISDMTLNQIRNLENEKEYVSKLIDQYEGLKKAKEDAYDATQKELWYSENLGYIPAAKQIDLLLSGDIGGSISNFVNNGLFKKEWEHADIIRKGINILLPVGFIFKTNENNKSEDLNEELENYKELSDELYSLQNKQITLGNTSKIESEILNINSQLATSKEALIEYETELQEMSKTMRNNLDEDYSEMAKLQEGGNVDLFNRPKVLNSNGDYETVYTHTYSNESGTRFINFTPIMVDEDGNYIGTLSDDQLQGYAEEVIAGIRTDNLKLQIGTEFKTVEAAEEAAKRIDELQEKYFSDSDWIDIEKLQSQIDEIDKMLSSDFEIEEINVSDGVIDKIYNTFSGMYSGAVSEVVPKLLSEDNILSLFVQQELKNIEDYDTKVKLLTTSYKRLIEPVETLYKFLNGFQDGGLITAFAEIFKLWNENSIISSFDINVFDDIKERFDNIKVSFNNIKSELKPVFDVYIQYIKRYFPEFATFIDNINSAIALAVNGILAIFSPIELIAEIVRITSIFIDGILVTVEDIITKIESWTNSPNFQKFLKALSIFAQSEGYQFEYKKNKNTNNPENAYNPYDSNLEEETSVSNQILKISTEIDETEFIDQFNHLLNSDKFKSAKEHLMDLSNEGKLDADTLQSYRGFNSILEDLGIALEDDDERLQQMLDLIDDIAKSDGINALDQYSTDLDSLKDAYTNFTNGELITPSQLKSLKSSYGSFDSYKALEEAVMTGNTDLQDYFNDLAAEMLFEDSALDRLNESNKEYYIQSLKTMGITNAQDVVEKSLVNTQKERENVLKELSIINSEYGKTEKDAITTTEQLENATADELMVLALEADQAGISSPALAAYALQKSIVEETLFDESTEIDSLIKVAEMAGIAGGALKEYNEIKKKLEWFESGDAKGHMPSDAYSSQKKYWEDKAKGFESDIEQQIDAVLKDTHYEGVDIEFSAPIDDASGAAETFKEILDKILAMYDAELDAGVTSFKEYVNKSRSIIEQYYRDGKISAQEYYDSLSDFFNKQISEYDKVISAVTRKINEQIDALNDQKESIEESYNLQIEEIQKKIDALQDENDEIDKNMALQKAQYVIMLLVGVIQHETSNYIG